MKLLICFTNNPMFCFVLFCFIYVYFKNDNTILSTTNEDERYLGLLIWNNINFSVLIKHLSNE